MSKCSVLRTLKSKCSHCTLLRPKYCAFSDVEANRRKRKATASLRIESTSPFENSESSVSVRAAKLLPRPERNATPQSASGCCEEVNGLDLSGTYLCSILNACSQVPEMTPWTTQAMHIGSR